MDDNDDKLHRNADGKGLYSLKAEFPEDEHWVRAVTSGWKGEENDFFAIDELPQHLDKTETGCMYVGVGKHSIIEGAITVLMGASQHNPFARDKLFELCKQQQLDVMSAPLHQDNILTISSEHLKELERIQEAIMSEHTPLSSILQFDSMEHSIDDMMATPLTDVVKKKGKKRGKYWERQGFNRGGRR